MQATRFRAAALFAVSVAASAPGCGDGDVPSQAPCKHCGGEGGSPDGSGGAGLGGDDSNASGSATLPNGGAAAAANVGGAAGEAGADTHTGGSGGTSAGGEGGGGGTVGDGREQLELCVRLAQPGPNATAVDMAYTTAVTLDCRVKWIMPKGQDLADFQNQVLRFNYAFWGCPQWPPVDAFALVFGMPTLSQGDANLLIGHYLKAAQDKLDLSPVERETMQAALVRLSKPLIMDASLEPSKSVCPVNMGGTGGADAGGAGAGGAGGAPANSGGGTP
jgi:hypothetical protein